MAQDDPASKVVQVAQGWVGRDFHPGESAQCAPFVRHVFAEAGVAVGSTANPTDAALLFASDGLSPNFADSFAGDDVGRRVSLAEALPGDIVMFKNTYGEWRDGVITHVGIYVGDNDMVDRSTSAHPVSQRSVFTFSGGPCEIRRPKAFDSPRTRLELTNGQVKAKLKGSKVYALDVKLHVKHGLVVAVNNSAVQAKAVNMHMKDGTTGKRYKISMTGGAARASVNDQVVQDLLFQAKFNGGALHVLVFGKEIRTTDLAVEVVHAT